MLISYPVLENAVMDELLHEGPYPVTVFTDDGHKGLSVGWHGGVHLDVGHGTSVESKNGYPVRAIADGTVVAYRIPTGKPALPIPDTETPDPKTPEGAKKLRQKHLGYNGWTDDGFVILKHEKECGKDRPVVFYSLYMHLSEILHDDLKNLKGSPGELKSSPKKQIRIQGQLQEVAISIKRKETIGSPGTIEDQKYRIHFEIFTDEANLNKFFPPEPTTDAPTPEGSMDPWGEMYFKIPAGQSLYAQKPESGPLPSTDLSIPADLCIAMSYQDGHRFFRSLDVNGYELEHWKDSDSTAEYSLFQQAKALDKNKMSRGYELMRFARTMDWPDLVNDLVPSPKRCWHYLPMVDGWVNFADDAVHKLTDADFPKWRWEKVAKGKAGFDPFKGECEVSKLLSAIDENGDGNLANLEFDKWLHQDMNQVLLRQMVVQFQSEWDASKADERWGWVKEMWADKAKHEQDALKLKQDWVNEQKKKSEDGKPIIQGRIQQVSDWLTKLETKHADAVKTADAATDKWDKAKKALADFVGDVDQQKTTWPPLTPAAKHNLEVAKQKKKLNDAVTKALAEKKDAEAQVPVFDKAIAGAKAWKANEEKKLNAAEDVIKNAQPEIDKLKDASKKSAEADAKKKADDPTLAQKMKDQAATDFEKYKKYMDALQFWQEVKKKVDAQAKKEEDKFPDSTLWHFHPLAFVEYFKKCHWLSKDDLKAIYPDKLETIENGRIQSEPVSNETARETYRVHINRVLWKYGWTSPVRMAHFFGQAWVESSALTGLREGSEGEFRAASLAPEPNGFYKDPWDIYYTHVVHYNAITSNTDKEHLVDSKGNPVDLDAEFKKSDEDLTAKIKKTKEEKFDANPLNAQIQKAKAEKRDAKTIADLEKQLTQANDAFDKEKARKVEELEQQFKKKKDRYRKIAKEKVDKGKSDPGDGQKFRGRGMKQLTSRENYAAYWVWRCWLKERMNSREKGDFDWHWWDSPGKVPAPIPDPQRVSEDPFNAVDSGGWYFLTCPAHPSDAPMCRYIKSESDVSPGTILAISKALNGQQRQENGRVEPNALDDRIKRTLQVFQITGDQP